VQTLHIEPLIIKDVSQVAVIHWRELQGFLPSLGKQFLSHFYRKSMGLSGMFTFVAKEEEGVVGFVTSVESPKGLYGRILSIDPFGFLLLVVKHLIFYPLSIVKMIKILSYPGFSHDEPELLTIAVDSRYQGKGIGRKLFAQVVKEFKNRKINKFKISVYDKLAANGFYYKIGCRLDSSFEFLGETMNYYEYVIPNEVRNLSRM